MSAVKRIDIKEFREKGFLQEANRLFFHPHGLALEVNVDNDSGAESLGGIWDYREDPEGIYYDIKNLPQEDRDEMKSKAVHVETELQKHSEARIQLFQQIIEPIPG